MSNLFNEIQADGIVIDTLLKQLRRSKNMSKVIVAKDGTIYEAHEFHILTEQELNDKITACQNDLTELLKVHSETAATTEQPATTPLEATPAAEASGTSISEPVHIDVTTPQANPVENPSVVAAVTGQEAPVATQPEVTPAAAPEQTQAPVENQHVILQ